MEQDVENIEDSNLLFDVEMLNKLRRCSIIPRSPSDFEVFVRSLAGDTISDVVIQEVWKQIYSNQSESASLLAPAAVNESQDLTYNNSSKSDKDITDSIHESFEFSSRKISKQSHVFHSAVEVCKKAEIKSCSENEVKMSNCDFENIATQCPVRKENIGLHSNAPVSRRKVKRKISNPVMKTPEHIIQSCSQENVKARRVLKRDGMEEQNSSDCEIIEIVSHERTNTSVNIKNSESETYCINERNESDSDESVEILDPVNNRVKKRTEISCPIHGNNVISNTQCSQERNTNRKQKSMISETDSVEDNGQVKLVNKKKQLKDKKGRRRKYKMLRSEVKHLKSLLVNLLMSLKSPKMSASEEGTANKPRNGKESFHSEQHRKKTGSICRTAATERLKASAFVEVNMSRKTTKLNGKKRQTTKQTKSCSEQPPIVVELDSEASDLDNGKRKKFLWRETIADVLRPKLGRWMPVEKLKRTVIAKYYYSRGNVSQNTTVKFFRYLHSTAGVIVKGDMAIYCNEPLIKVSSRSEKKRVVLKTLTTTKEYKVS